MLNVLPLTLLVLLFALPVFSEQTSSNDVFRALALRKPKQPENPICCLKPLTPSEPVDDGILLSFEEWKLKQQATQPETLVRPNEMNTSNPAAADGSIPNDSGGGTEAPIPPGSADNLASPGAPSAGGGQPPSAPHFRVPLTDRFNYASLDCSARVHLSHRSAKSPSSILSSKRDRYMLSPCDKSKGRDKQFVVVELCDDIRIDTVQLANFEFFSGVFKDFTVSVSKTYDLDPDSWTAVATYRAKNVRGVQSFHPPKSLRDFYRFIRIDFLSNYGNEFYCPVSLLRVYGLTHLEEWKWDTWEAESRSKQAELQRKKQPDLVVETAPDAPIASTIVNPTIVSTEGAPEHSSTPDQIDPTPISIPPSSQAAPTPSSFENSKPNHDTVNNRLQPKPPSYTNPNAALMHHPTDTHVSSSPSISPIPSPSESQHKNQASDIPTPSKSSTESPFKSASISSTRTLTSTSSSTTAAISISTSSPSNIPSTSNSSHSHSSSNPGTPAPTPTIIISSASPSVAVIPIPPPPLPPAIKGGESIYRTIMNRLAEVELNQTLYMRYIEQQNLAVREVIKRLGEDVGRLEGISRAQSVTYQRTMNEWEKQRYQLEMEYGDLISRIEYLSEEIVLEKRLGVAQLCLLLAVLVFLGLTRGSTPITHSNQSVREWANFKRHFKISGDWAGRFKGRNRAENGERREGRSRSRSRSRSSSRLRTGTIPRTPPPPRPASARPKSKSAKSYPPALPLHLQLADDIDNENDSSIIFPSTSRPYRTKEPLETIYLNQLNTAPLSRENRNRPRAISNPRSRAPSLRSTPASRRTAQYNHNHNYSKAATPAPTAPTFGTASASASVFRPQMMQRSSSYGLPVPLSQSNSWGAGSMSMPKSAKKWARTAHLHEVKTANVPPNSAGVGVRRSKKGEDEERTPRVFEFGRGREDVFARPLEGLNLKEPTVDVVGPPPAESLLFKAAAAAAAEDDGDPWVDTDSVDGDADGEASELDVDQFKFVGVGSGDGPSPMSSPREPEREDTVRVIDMLPIPFPA